MSTQDWGGIGVCRILYYVQIRIPRQEFLPSWSNHEDAQAMHNESGGVPMVVIESARAD